MIAKEFYIFDIENNYKAKCIFLNMSSTNEVNIKLETEKPDLKIGDSIVLKSKEENTAFNCKITDIKERKEGKSIFYKLSKPEFINIAESRFFKRKMVNYEASINYLESKEKIERKVFLIDASLSGLFFRTQTKINPDINEVYISINFDGIKIDNLIGFVKRKEEINENEIKYYGYGIEYDEVLDIKIRERIIELMTKE